MTAEMIPVPGYSRPAPTPGKESFWRTAHTETGNYETPRLPDRASLDAFPTMMNPSPTGSSGTSFAYQEDISAFMSDTKIEYEGKDGSKVFIHFSYVAISKKVHYEILQNGSGIEGTPEAYPHPSGDYFGPKATADRILDFARGLVNKFRAMEGEDLEKLGNLIRELIKGIDKGFRLAEAALRVMSPRVGSMIQETRDRVMEGMARLEEEFLKDKGKGASSTHLVFEEEISYRAASLEISVIA